MSAHFVRLSVACFLLLGVALIFVSEGAEAGTWEQMDDHNVQVDNTALTVYDSESDRIIIFESENKGHDVYAYKYDNHH